jgi:hypothetical protein
MHVRRVRTQMKLAAMLVFLSVGCQEHMTAPPTTATDSVNGGACENQCDIVADAGVLSAARFQVDSAAFPVFLARITVSGQASGIVQLAMLADDAVLERLPKSELVRVETPTGVRSFPLRDLASAAEVYRFVGAESVTLTYSLNRQMPPVTSGSFRLVQTTSGGTVSASNRPWQRSVPVVRALATAAGSCSASITSQSSSACGVLITTSPFVTGALGGTFSSAACCGASHNVVVTFAPGVSSVTATIYDPTYSGNRMVATDANGVVVGSADFAFSNQPGVNVPDAKTISIGTVVAAQLSQTAAAPAGIARLDLVASTGVAQGDYVSWSVSFIANQQIQNIDVVCTGSGQIRGSTISCDAKPHDPAGTLLVSGWTFISSAGDIVHPPNQQTGTNWTGKLVIGGAISVQGTVSGQSATGTANVTVLPRDWSAKTMVSNHTNPGADILPLRPTAFQDQLGLTDVSTVQRPDVGSLFVLVSDGGPNDGFAYMTEIPYIAVTVSRVNYPAMLQGSDWYKIQEIQDRKSGKTLYCGQPRVLTLVPLVEAHEGTNPPAQPLSHSGIFIADELRDARIKAEAIAGPGVTLDLTPVLNQINSVAVADSRAMDHDSRNNINGTTLPCVFHYDYSHLP